jgi:hypothetical protein
LRQAKLQEEKEINELDNIIRLGKKKQEFDCLHKIREACKIAQILNKPFTFVTTTRNDSGLEIIKEEGDTKEVLTMDGFMREYNKLKREENSFALTQLKPAPGTSKMMTGMETNMLNAMNSMKSQNKDSKKEKQKKLLEVLKDTMKLTQILKEQLKILEEKGICGNESTKK